MLDADSFTNSLQWSKKKGRIIEAANQSEECEEESSQLMMQT